ncbi:MAG: polyprenol monophosphomannose synthase [Myxococcales bacterium]|nr:polyprenol monophosphomannose synthase [Myxococcales bacterium]
MSAPRPLVVIPTYNEKDNLPTLLDAVHGALPSAHVLVVDDNSPDGTGALADARAAADKRVHVLHRPGKQGLGRAYLAGFAWALERDYTHVFEMDADFSHDPRALPVLLAATEEADVALGSRWVEGGGTVGWPLKRRLMSRGGSFYARTILGVDVRDLTGGFKCFRREVLAAIEPDEVKTVGYGFQIELTWRALQKGFRVVEVPIRFVDRVAGQSKMSGAIFREALVVVWKLRLGLI